MRKRAVELTRMNLGFSREITEFAVSLVQSIPSPEERCKPEAKNGVRLRENDATSLIARAGLRIPGGSVTENRRRTAVLRRV